MAEPGGNADPLRTAMSLNSDQLRDERLQPNDESREEETDISSIGGGMLGSPALELDRQRGREARMRSRQEQFVGKPSEDSPQTPGEETRAQAERPQQAPTEDESPVAEDEDERSAALESKQQRDRENARQQTLLAAAGQQVKQADAQSKQQLLDYIKMADVGLSVESLGTSLLLNNVIIIGQVINKYVFKNSAIPEPRFEEEMCCVGCNLGYALTCPFQPPCYWGCAIIFLAGALLLLFPAIDLVKHAT